MLQIDSLVPEVAVDLEDPLEPPHHEPLQVELRGDTQVEVHAQGIVEGLERPCRGPARYGLHHGGFHLQKLPLDEKLPHGLDDPASKQEDLLDLVIHDQVDVPLPVPRLLVRQPVPLLRKGPQGLGQQPDIFRQKGQLVCPRPEKNAL